MVAAARFQRHRGLVSVHFIVSQELGLFNLFSNSRYKMGLPNQYLTKEGEHPILDKEPLEMKKEMDKKKEFSVFLILSAFGLLINEVVMYVCIDGVYAHSPWLKELVSDGNMVALSSVLATVIVMVYNFISRKLFLERK